MSRLTSPRRIFSLLLALFINGAILCFGQSTSTLPSLRGKVIDQNKAAIVGATVVARANDRSGKFTAITDQYGEFSLTLTSGEYSLSVTASGFTEASKVVRVGEGSVPLLEISMAVAETEAVVNVIDMAGYQTNTIGTATKTLAALRDTPQSITVVTREQIKDQSFQSITDIVTYIPGISSHQGENNRDQLIIRGNSTSADFFLNGVRDDVQYYRDLYNVDRVEVLKGPNSMIFGRGGGGGIVNRVTREAGFSAFRELVLQGGSFNNHRGTIDISQPFSDKVAFRANGLYENSGTFRQNVDLERYGLNPTLTYVPNTKTRFTFGYEYFHDRRTADRGIPSFQGRPAPVDISLFYGNPNLAWAKADVNFVYGSFERQIGRFSIRNRTQFGDYDRKYQNFVPGAVNASQTLVALTSYNNATKRQNLFNQTDVTVPFSTGKWRHNFLFGAELGRQITDNFRNTGFFNNVSTTIQVPYNNPTINTPVTFRQIATDANNHVQARLGAAYIQDQVDVSRYIQFIAGLRFDYFDLAFHNNRNGDNLGRVDQLFSPRLGLVIKPKEPLSIYGSYSVAYLPGSGDQFSSLTVITQQLKPEKFTNYEVGVKWDIRRTLSLTTALYRQDRTNTRSVDPNNPLAIIQTGSQRTNGFEIGVNGNITNDWRVVGGYAYQDAYISSATAAAALGANVAQVPHNTFSLWNNYRFMARLSAGLGLIYRGDMFAAIDNTVVLPGYFRADAAVYYNFNENWRLQGNLENIFDRTYYINADGNNNISPGRPRGARVALTARF